ncbi:MAG: 16S rRNA (uracil(1498)-N(3))-methyltransferase [Saprospiraceae bacterium]|nr:16S rRNA (uracil(1498)-N(3))-methyltransferase [Saprospiraceae bacterium]
MNQLFYTQKIENGFAYFDEEEGRHLVTVLRRKPGDRLHLTDGRGHFYEAELAETGKKHAVARILHTTAADTGYITPLHLAIAPTKQIERMEWLFEKATEIGIHSITLLHCQRSERDTVRTDRLEKVLVSAMKQSLRAHLPVLHPMTRFADFVKNAKADFRFIAWCADQPMPHLKTQLQPGKSTLILIGPEGDFSPEEVQLAENAGFTGISLGAARLRTETAGLLAVSAVALL